MVELKYNDIFLQSEFMSASKTELRKSMQQYGKEKLSEKEQIKILNLILDDAKNKLAKDSEIYNLILELQLKFKEKENLKEAIILVNQFIIELETKDKDSTTIDYLKKHGFYRIVYRNSQIKGRELPSDDILHQLLRNGFIGVALSALIITLFAATAFFTAPFWITAIVTGLFVGASVYLSGILYGVVNDLFATHSNLPYFLLGHQPQQTSLLRTNDKVAQGIAWGVAATFGPVLIATVLFTVAATITAFFVPLATFILPALMLAMPLIAVGAEFYARNKAREYIEQDKQFLYMGANGYQREGLDYMSPTQAERAAWYANSDRNVFGFGKVPLIGLGALAGLIVLSAVSMFLPPLLFVSPVIAVAIPAAFAATACIALLAGGAYMYINRNTQLDDRYRLEFDRDSIETSLYLDEDMDYVRGLIKADRKQVNVETITPDIVDQSNYASPLYRKSMHTRNDDMQEALDVGNGLT